MRFVIFLCLVAQVFSLFCASDFENGCFCKPNNRGDDCICEGNCNGGNLSNYLVVAVTSSGILKAKQKLGITFNSDKLGGIDFTKFSKLTIMCSA